MEFFKWYTIVLVWLNLCLRIRSLIVSDERDDRIVEVGAVVVAVPVLIYSMHLIGVL